MRRRFPLGFGPHLGLALLSLTGCFDEPGPVDDGADTPSTSTTAGTPPSTTIDTSSLTTGVSLASATNDGGTDDGGTNDGGTNDGGTGTASSHPSTSTSHASSTSATIEGSGTTTLVPASTSSDSLAIDTLDASTGSSGESTQGGSSMGSTGSTGSTPDDSSSSGSGEESTGGEPTPTYCEMLGANAVFCEDFDHEGWRDHWTLIGQATAFHQADGFSPPHALGISTEGLASDIATLAISRPSESALESGFTFRTALHVADFCPTDRTSVRTLISITTAPSVGPSRTGTRLMLRMRARALQLVFIPNLAVGLEEVTDLRAGLADGQWTHVALAVSSSAVEVFIDDVQVPPGEIPLTDAQLGSSQRVFAVGQINFADSATSSCEIAFDDVVVFPRRG